MERPRGRAAGLYCPCRFQRNQCVGLVTTEVGQTPAHIIALFSFQRAVSRVASLAASLPTFRSADAYLSAPFHLVNSRSYLFFRFVRSLLRFPRRGGGEVELSRLPTFRVASAYCSAGLSLFNSRLYLFLRLGRSLLPSPWRRRRRG